MNEELIIWLEKRLNKSLAMDRNIYADLVDLLKTLTHQPINQLPNYPYEKALPK